LVVGYTRVQRIVFQVFSNHFEAANKCQYNSNHRDFDAFTGLFCQYLHSKNTNGIWSVGVTKIRKISPYKRLDFIGLLPKSLCVFLTNQIIVQKQINQYI
jgi:hypothetical protein